MGWEWSHLLGDESQVQGDACLSLGPDGTHVQPDPNGVRRCHKKYIQINMYF
jgi:hypothetical protein